MRKRILRRRLSFLAGVVVATLVLIGRPAPVEGVVEPRPAEGMYFRLVTHGSPGCPFWHRVRQGMEDAAALLGATAVMDLSGGDMGLQAKQFAEAVAGRPDGIALVINDDKIWDKPVADALAAGIPVIAINCDDTQGAAGNPRLSFIGQDDEQVAYKLGIRLFEEGKKRGIDLANAHIVFGVEKPGHAYAVLRAAGIKRAMEKYGIISFEELDTGYEMGIVEARMTAYLIANPHTTFIIGAGGMATDRLAASIKGAGLAPGEVIAGGFDTTPGTLQGIREGYITATIDQEQYLQGYLAVFQLFLHAKYGFTPVDIEAGGGLIDDVADIELIEELSPLLIR